MELGVLLIISFIVGIKVGKILEEKSWMDSAENYGHHYVRKIGFFIVKKDIEHERNQKWNGNR